MKTAVFSSFTINYIAQARTLVSTLKKYNKHFHFIALIVEHPSVDLAITLDNEEFDEIVWANTLPIQNYEKWISKHTIVEACTAIKGCALHQIATRGEFDAVMYLDPDIAVFNSLEPLIERLNNYDILLTPHQLTPQASPDEKFIIDHELGSTKHGTYNLGFICINTRSEGSGLEFANWWHDRLLRFCKNDIQNGLFTDQKWCDLVPAYFDKVNIVRDCGYNVASWNINQRYITFSEKGELFANNQLLRFFHFTKINTSGFHEIDQNIGENYEVFELCNWYQKQLENNSA